MNIRNVAIIAHVDHGKTTLVDALLRQSNTKLNKEQASQDTILDSNELERERGITIFSKNASVHYKDYKINIIDTPGHADFGGEVERVLKMADGALLLVDAKEGPMPQTRFVLKKALALGLKIIVVINKIDKVDARSEWVLGKTFDLFVELGAAEEHAFFPVVYAIGKEGKSGYTSDKLTDITPIFETIIREIPEPMGEVTSPLQILVTTIRGDNYKGRIATGRIANGRIKKDQMVAHINRDGKISNYKLTSLIGFEGLGQVEIDEAQAGDIVAIAGIPDVNIGETIADPASPVPLPLIDIEQPTVKIHFGVNTSPFAGREGKFTTSRQIRERLNKELETDMALKVEENGDNTWTISGRGELHLAILIERLRREGFELQVSRPQVITKNNLVPFESCYIESPEEFSGVIMQQMGERHGALKDMKNENGITYFEFLIPTRGLFGYRSQFLTDTKGLGIINTSFDSFREDFDNWRERQNGSLTAFESGTTMLYGLMNVQERGVLFVGPGVPVYKGMVIGQNSRAEDIAANCCREKHLTNHRANAQVTDHFNAPKIMSLEDALDYIDDSELIEVTPQSVRIRKRILDPIEAKKAVRGLS